jgi:ABC-type transport system involved in Fe-S cluster assembly fused permease/ATPase subunit
MLWRKSHSVADAYPVVSSSAPRRLPLTHFVLMSDTLHLLQATSALDATSEAQVQSALDRAMKETTRSCLVIAHRCPETALLGSTTCTLLCKQRRHVP